MLSSGLVLKKISDSTFEEVNDKDSINEWKNSFKTLSLPLNNINVFSLFNTHDREFDFKGEFDDEPHKRITPEIRNGVVIETNVDLDQCNDYIYCTVEKSSESEEDLYSLERPSDGIKVALRAGDPLNGFKRLPDGAYYGSCFRSNFDPGKDELIIEMSLPKEQLASISDTLLLDTSPSINLSVQLLSFSSAIDDSLREPHYPRDVFVPDHTEAVVGSISLNCKPGRDSIQLNSEAGEQPIEAAINLTPEEIRHREMLQSIDGLKQQLMIALWIIVGLLISIFVF